MLFLLFFLLLLQMPQPIFAAIDPKHVVVLTRKQVPFGSEVTPTGKLWTEQPPDAIQGYCKDLMDKLSTDMKFNYTWALGKDAGSIVNALYTNASQFSLGCSNLLITPEREELVDFTQPLMDAAFCLVVPMAVASSAGLWAFLQPFTLSLWGVIIATTVCFGFLLWILETHWIAKDQPNDTPHITGSMEWACSAILSYSYARPYTFAGHTVYGAFFLFVIVINASYTANLAAVLATKNAQNALTGFGDLRESNTVCTTKGGSSEKWVTAEIVNKGKGSAIFLDTVEDCMNSTVNGVVDATIAGCSPAEYAITAYSDFCSLMPVGAPANPSGYGLAVRNGEYDFLNSVNVNLLQYRADGSLAAMEKKWFDKGNAVCDLNIEQRQAESETSTSSQLGPESLAGLYIVMFSIVGLGAVHRLLTFLTMKVRAKKMKRKLSEVTIADTSRSGSHDEKSCSPEMSCTSCGELTQRMERLELLLTEMSQDMKKMTNPAPISRMPYPTPQPVSESFDSLPRPESFKNNGMEYEHSFRYRVY